MTYNPWPLGRLPKEFQRPEPEMIRDKYPWDDPRDIIDIFEKKVAKFAGSNYAVATDSCSHAIFLCLRMLDVFYNRHRVDISIPYHTYISVPHQIYHAKYGICLNDVIGLQKWAGVYNLNPTRIWDAALRWTKGMYIKDSLMCLSFQIKKRIPIGRGGMILCNNETEYWWLKLASYDGRELNTPYDSKGHAKMIGYHYYMTPEDAARGIILMDKTPEVNEDQGGWENYPDIRDVYRPLRWLQHR